MALLEHINTSMPLTFYPVQADLDVAFFEVVRGVQPVILSPRDASRFLNWVKNTRWRNTFEEDLQCISMDAENRRLLTTDVPLVTFRNMCMGGRQMQDEQTVALMERIRTETRSWRAHGIDLVDVSGYESIQSAEYETSQRVCNELDHAVKARCSS